MDRQKTCKKCILMREALVIAKTAICHHALVNHTCNSLAWENDTSNANCCDILCGHRDLCKAKTAIQKALSEPVRNCDVCKDVRTLLEEYIAMRGFTSDNQIRALYELALPVIEWLLEPTEKMKGESRWIRTN